MNTEIHENPAWTGFNNLWKLVAIILAIVVLALWFLGFGADGSRCGSVAAAGQECEAAESATEAESATGTSNQSEAESGLLDFFVPAYGFKQGGEVSRVYFDKASAELPANAAEALAIVLTALDEDPDAVAVISGFHDPSGDLTFNQELSRNRAVSVRDYLQSTGLAEERLVLEKPASTTGSGDDAEARRVEVALAYLK